MKHLNGFLCLILATVLNFGPLSTNQVLAAENYVVPEGCGLRTVSGNEQASNIAIGLTKMISSVGFVPAVWLQKEALGVFKSCDEMAANIVDLLVANEAPVKQFYCDGLHGTDFTFVTPRHDKFRNDSYYGVTEIDDWYMHWNFGGNDITWAHVKQELTTGIDGTGRPATKTYAIRCEADSPIMQQKMQETQLHRYKEAIKYVAEQGFCFVCHDKSLQGQIVNQVRAEFGMPLFEAE